MIHGGKAVVASVNFNGENFLEFIMYVYFMQSGEKGPIKIGKSNNPEKRLKSLQTGSAHKLHIVAIVPCENEMLAFKLEAKFHKLLRKRRMSGEWYYPDFSIKNLMERAEEKTISFTKTEEKNLKAMDEQAANHMQSIMQE